MRRSIRFHAEARRAERNKISAFRQLKPSYQGLGKLTRSDISYFGGAHSASYRYFKVHHVSLST
jgi:hypothetical protein